MSLQRVSISTAALVAILTGAGGFALGQATRSPSSDSSSKLAKSEPDDFGENDNRGENGGTGDMSGSDLPPNHPAVDTNGGDLPPEHPAVNGNANGSVGAGASGEATLKWTAPARWKSMPSPNSMRLATYSVPHAPGDGEDAEVAVTQVGGDVDANIDRWVGQFGPGAQSTLKRSPKVVRGMHVTLVQIDGTYSGGMDPSQGAKKDWALCGGIVETETTPYFFKMTGPAKTVHSACSELDTMLGTVAPK